MKNRKYIKILTSSLAFALVAVPGLAYNGLPSPERAYQYEEERASSTISGKIESKDDSSFDVDGETIIVNEATVFRKNGEEITFGDVSEGDEVVVITSKTAMGDLRAVSVEVSADRDD
ncbi:MAG: hypothetical protein JJU00_02310 [Opitutales bacterium]|nr:hypothetical protein [Opitutales bacterium]